LSHAAAQEAPEEPQIFLDGELIPADEGAVLDRLHSWLDKRHWTPGWEEGDTAAMTYSEIERLAGEVTRAPWLALGLGQAALLYFWWRGSGLEVDVPAGRLASMLHRVSIQYAGCDDPQLPQEAFAALQCSWRWRHSFMIPAELGIHLARQRRSPHEAAGFLREAADIWALMRRLPHFSRTEWPTPYAVNSNANFFPGPVNRPVWDSSGVPFAQHLEANVDVFRSDLNALLEDGRFDHLYWTGEVSLTQFAPRHEGWAMVSLIKNGKLLPRACEAAKASCEVLSGRSEIAKCTAGDAGVAFARLLPGHGLRPHFWNAPRMGVHLGLRTPPGASMWVGGQEVVWEEGKATVFDDTYMHSVLHEGTEARYLLIAWFCHPCDRERAAEPPERPEPLCGAQS